MGFRSIFIIDQYLYCHQKRELLKNKKNFFLNILHIFFYYFAIISPWGRMWAFTCKTLNSIYPRKLCAKFGRNWHSSFKEMIFKYFQYNFTISLLSPLWKGRGPLFEQTWISSTQGCFVSSLVEIDQVVLNRKIFNQILLFSYYLPLEKGTALQGPAKFWWNYPNGSGDKDF